nr:YesL family protein [Caldanaerobacter subterraneus]
MRDSKLWDFAYFVTDLMILNVLWLLASLPVITVFHSTDALFYSIRLLRKDEGGSVFLLTSAPPLAIF